MKETTIGLKALNLLDAALSLAGILDQPIKGNCITVNYSTPWNRSAPCR